MLIDYDLLTDHAMCDKATEEVDFKLLTYSTHDAVGVLTDTRANRSQSSTAAQLSVVNSKIAAADILLATAGIEPGLLEKTTDERAALLVRRTTLSKRGRNADGLDHFLSEVDAEQVDTQVAALTTIKAGIATHRATLTS
ncbi:MAG: hypothetical protein M3Y54_09995 [Bacteroidota bacterium]|nr:hypothetical protein [Bacteroidota bacterium]